jgi:hypothetical protein
MNYSNVEIMFDRLRQRAEVRSRLTGFHFEFFLTVCALRNFNIRPLIGSS